MVVRLGIGLAQDQKVTAPKGFQAMTALEQFERLESIGLWKEAADDQRREVIVSFGDASLVLSNHNEVPLTHWSLAAVRRTKKSGSTVPSVPAGNTEEAPHQIDGLSGATITSNGVTNMIALWFSDQAFGPYLKKFRETGA